MLYCFLLLYSVWLFYSHTHASSVLKFSCVLVNRKVSTPLRNCVRAEVYDREGEGGRREVQNRQEKRTAK